MSSYNHTSGEETHGFKEGTFSSFPPAPLPYSGKPDSLASLRLNEPPITLPPQTELKWCLSWALIFSSMVNSDKIVFGAIPARPDTHPSPTQDTASNKAKSPLPIHMQISHHASIFQLEESIANQLRVKASDHTSGTDPSKKALCSPFSAVVSVRRKSLAGAKPDPDTHHLPLSVELVLVNDEALVIAKFDSTIIGRWMVDTLLRRVAIVMPQLSDSSKSLWGINLMSKHELDKIWGWNSYVPEPVGRLVHSMITERARMHPDRVALSAWDGELTYHELDQLADKVSIMICRRGARPGDLIPLCFEKSLWAFVGILGVLKAGCAVVPLDPSLPLKRLRMIIDQVHAPLVLSSATGEVLGSQLASRVVVVGRETLANVVNGELSTTSATERPDPGSPMYVVFTSDTTGVPKGVVITHTSFASAFDCQTEVFRYSQETRFYDWGSIGFGVSINTLQVLLAGGCICVPTDLDRMENLVTSISALRANAIFLTPTVARLLEPAHVPSLDMVLLGGEAVQESDVERWWGQVRVINVYSPSECTLFSVVNAHPETPSEAVRIGFGAGQATWIVDPSDHEKLLPLGCTGELLLEGPLNGNHYLGNPSKTAASFINPPSWLIIGRAQRSCRAYPDPDAEGWSSPGPLYKTGDLVHYHCDGSITFVGRKDSQAQIHGQRVELGEIESYLKKQMPNARHVVAEVVERKGEAPTAFTSTFVVAFVQAVDAAPVFPGKSSLTLTDLEPMDDEELAATSLAALVPRHMVPTVAFRVPSIPMTLTGKTDRQKLRELSEVFLFSKLQKARNGQETGDPGQVEKHGHGSRWLQEIWGHILGIDADAVDANTDFFRMGGSSVLAMNIIAEARARGFALTLADVFRHPLLVDLAKQARPLREDDHASKTPGGCLEPFSLLPAGIASRDAFQNQLGSQYNLDPTSIEDVYPATPIQEGLMTLSLQAPGDYFTQRVLELSPQVSIKNFRDAWGEVARRVALLRTRMVQHVDVEGFLQLVSSEPISWDDDTGLGEYLDRDRSTPMLMGHCLARFAVVRDVPGGNPRWFVLSLHHAVYDGWMLPLLFRIASQTYQGCALPPLRPFKAFVKYITGQDGTEAKNYWVEALEGCKSSPFPPIPRTHATSERVKYVLPHLSRPKASSITESTLIRAAWAIVAGDMTSSRHVSFGIVVSGRGAPVEGITEIIGPTMATVPFFVELNKAQKLADFLESTQQQTNGMAPFEQTGLQNISRMSPSCRQACSFQTLLLIQPEQTDAPHDVVGQWQESDEDQYSTYGLVIEVELGANIATVRFNPSVLELQTVQKLLERFGAVLIRLALGEDGPDTTVADLQSATEQGVEKIWQWNSHVPEPVEQFAHDIIHQQALSNPDGTALDAWNGVMSYRELDEYASGLAEQIIGLGSQQTDLVPLCFEKSIWTIVSVLGVLKSGKAFVIFEPSLPEQRLRTMYNQVGSEFMLCSHACMELSSKISPKAIPVGPGTVQRKGHRQSGPTVASPPQRRPLEKVMYSVFTSGSTGTPKGVLISHANFCSALKYQLPILGFNSDTRILDFVSYAFDMSVHNIIAALAIGGCLCIPSEHDRRENLGGIFTTFSPTHATLTPTVARLIDPLAARSLKSMILIGEAVAVEDAQRWWGALKFINAYDPDDHECLLPPGSTGELLIDGPSVGLGYLGDAEKTAASFIKNPGWLLRGVPGRPGRRGRLYKTGDLVRYDDDGTLVYIGRKDTQVKIRGQRVELGEIEQQVEAHIEEATRVVAEVCTLSQGSLDPILCAFIQLKPEVETAISKDGEARSKVGIYSVSEEARKLMASHLPSHMIPRLFFSMSELPYTAAGKTDRRRLRELGSAAILQDISPGKSQSQSHPGQSTGGDEPIQAAEQPAHDLAKRIFSMLPSWAGHRLQGLGEETTFDDIPLHSSGLDSVNLMTLIHFISQTFHAKVTIQDLLGASMTIRGLARLISPTQQDSRRDPLVTDTQAQNLIAEIDKHYSRITSEATGLKASGQLTVLLTGATGFIGTQILRQLLQHGQVGRVIAVVRGETKASARQRTIAAAAKAPWWTDSCGDTLDVWSGDLSQPQLGLNTAQWRELEGVHVVIHNGAKVHWTMSYEALEATNVRSTVELAQLALRTPGIRMVYVAGGQTWYSSLQTERDMASELPTSCTLAYSRSKFVAEAVIRRAAATPGAKGRIGIVSPGLVIGTPDEGIANADDYLWRLVAACIRIGAYNEDDVEVWLHVSNARFTASTIISTALAEEVPVQTLVSEGMYWGSFWKVLREAGYQLRGMDANSWTAAVSQDINTAQEGHPLWPLAQLFEQQGTRDFAQ
ncbi:NRPS [Amphichorda felina]